MQPGGARTATIYTLNTQRVTDPAGKWREMTYDALGRLTAVQDGAGGGAGYAYDAAGRLRKVVQGVQTRHFEYDWAGRLLRATQPESGVTEYAYDGNGNLIRRKDARGVILCYGLLNGESCDGGGYDTLNRPTLQKYLIPAGKAEATPDMISCYDGRTYSGGACAGAERAVDLGRRTSVGTTAGSSDYRHDLAGRIMQSVEKRPGLPDAAFGYQYAANDAVIETAYPSARKLVTCPDGDGRPGWVSDTRTASDCLNGQGVGVTLAYARDVQYEPEGMVKEVTLGNGVIETWSYNERRQTTGVTASKGGAPLLTLALGYGSATGNNGNPQTQSIGAPARPAFNQTYNYDAANRLERIDETGGGAPWWAAYSYDAYGNMAVASSYPAHAAAVTNLTQYNTANNRIAFKQNLQAMPSDAYDEAGNLTNEPATGVMKYDGENRIARWQSGTAVVTFSYDGNGRRASKQSGLTTVHYVYDQGGKLAAEYGSRGSLGISYLTTDHLGSVRLVTDPDGKVLARRDFHPFGEEIPASATYHDRQLVQDVGVATYNAAANSPAQQFTGKERDAETGLDYFGARYMSAAQGRWTSPDQINVTRARLVNPSNTLNKYVYAANNPLKFVDPDGNDVTIYYRASTGLFTKDFGHVLIGALNQKTGQVAFLDFYPKAGAWPKGEINSNITLDRLRQHGSITIQTSPEAAQKVIDHINKLAQTVPNYDLSARLDRLEVTGMTCTILCQNVLKEIGIDFGGSYLPYDVWDSAYYTFVDSYRPPLWNPGSRGPMMVPAPYQANRDFGNWRFPGVDPYWLMYTLYKNGQSAEPKGCVAVSDSATGTKSKTCE